MHNVLLPVDGSRHAFEAALYLIDFAKLHGSIDVHVVNIEPAPLRWQGQQPQSETSPDQLTARAHIALKPVLHLFHESGMPHHWHVRLGDTAETIVALAKDYHCDTIVMGARGRGDLATLGHGSVTRKVLHLATVPVVCIRAGEH